MLKSEVGFPMNLEHKVQKLKIEENVNTPNGLFYKKVYFNNAKTKTFNECWQFIYFLYLQITTTGYIESL